MNSTIKIVNLFWVFAFLQICANAQTSITPKECCENDENLMINGKCAPDKNGKILPTTLKCEAKYMLNPSMYPEEDSFNVTEDGSLETAELKTNVPADEFCIANNNDKELDEIFEIAIVCFSETETEVFLSPLTFTLKAILIFTSVVFLLLTLYVYMMLPELRETQDKVTIFTVLNLLTFMFWLGIMQTQSPVDIIHQHCIALAFLVYFFTMGYFAWLNCTIATVWKTIVLRRWKVPERVWYLFAHIYGWTVPILLTLIVFIKQNMKPIFGESSCWFHHDSDQWRLVYLPISIMLALNVFLCIWMCLSLIHNDFTPDTRKALRYKCILYFRLFLLGGFTWIFEVLSYTFNDHAPSAWVWVIVDSFNCLHGVLIFFVLIIWRQRIRKELAGKRILGYYCPTRWSDIEDDEVCLENEGKGKYDLIIKTLK